MGKLLATKTYASAALLLGLVSTTWATDPRLVGSVSWRGSGAACLASLFAMEWEFDLWWSPANCRDRDQGNP